MQPADSDPEFTFTVFTATYNRANTLPRVYESLCRQSYGDFEWLIVDDGSTDGTHQLVEMWIAEDRIPIRYFWKENGGKHTATNLGVRQARGRLFLPLDSDDWCVPEALARLLHHWMSIPSSERAQFSAVTGLCVDRQGQAIGDFFPEEVFDSDSIERFELGIRLEKWGFQRTDVMRQFPYPEFEGEKFIAESFVWRQIAERYKTRYVNEGLGVYEPGNNALSSDALTLRIDSPQGTLLFYSRALWQGRSVRSKMRSAINLARFRFHTDMKPDLVGIPWPRHLIYRLLRPVGWIIFRWETRRQP